MTIRDGRRGGLRALLLGVFLTTGPLRGADLTPLDPKVRATVYRMVMDDEKALFAKVRSALEKRLSNPTSCIMRFFPKSKAELLQGRIKRIEVTMEGTVIKALRVRRGRMILHDFVLNYNELFKRGKIRFRRQGRVDFFLHVRQDDLNHMLRLKGHKMKLRSPHIALHDGWVSFKGQVKVLFFKNRVKVRGRLYVRNGTKVIFSPGSMNLDFLPVPGFLVRKISSKINPIADLSDFRIKLDCSVIEVRPGHLFLASASGRKWVEKERSRLLREEAARRAMASGKATVATDDRRPEEARPR